MRFAQVRYALTICALLLLIVGCTAAPIGEADGELVIGTLLPLTGVDADAGQAAREALDARISEISAATEFDRLQIRVVHADVRSDSSLLEAAVAELAANNVDVVIGPHISSQSTAVREMLNALGIVVHLSLTQPLEPQMIMMADALVTDGHQSVTLMMPSGTDTSVPDQLAEKLQENEAQLLSHIVFDPTAERFDPEVALAEQDASTAILIVGADNPQKLVTGLESVGAGPSGGRTIYVLGNSSMVQPAPGLRFIEPVAPLADRVVDRFVIAALAAARAGTDDPATVAGKIGDVVEGEKLCSSFATCLAGLRASENVMYSGIANNGFSPNGAPTEVPYSLNAFTADGEVNEDESRPITSR